MDSDTSTPVQPPAPNPQPVTASNETVMGVLAYIGILVIIPLIVSKDAFVKFHVKQGLVLFIIEIIISAVGYWIFWPFAWLAGILNLIVLILVIIGIINVVQKKEKELPVVGGLAKNFTF